MFTRIARSSAWLDSGMNGVELTSAVHWKWQFAFNDMGNEIFMQPPNAAPHLAVHTIVLTIAELWRSHR